MLGAQRRVPVQTTCVMCGEMVWIPPAVVYRGEAYHKQCAKIEAEINYSDEQYAPWIDQVGDDLETILDV